MPARARRRGAASRRGRTLSRAPRLEPSIYSFRAILISFVGLAIIAYLVDLPLWMIGLGGLLALLGYFLERRPKE